MDETEDPLKLFRDRVNRHFLGDAMDRPVGERPLYLPVAVPIAMATLFLSIIFGDALELVGAPFLVRVFITGGFNLLGLAAARDSCRRGEAYLWRHHQEGGDRG
jgi:hypothetical protein